MAAWYPLPGSLRGPKGDKGDQGDTGADGGTSPHATRHAAAGSDPVTPAAIGAAPASHTHPYPSSLSYGINSGGIPGTGLGPAGRSIATLTVPDPGFAWRPMIYGRVDIRSDIHGTQPAIFIQEGSASGPLFAHGAGGDAAGVWKTAWVVPWWGSVTDSVLAPGRSRTFHVVAGNDYGGGWIETRANNSSLALFVMRA